MDNGSFLDRDIIYEKCGGERRMGEEREEVEEED